MPKKIDVNREKVLEITKELLDNKRYDEINCRRIAELAGIGVGTLYHFFSSKMEIIATIIVYDWVKELDTINVETTLEEGIKNIYCTIKEFSTKYFDFWHQSAEDVSSQYVASVDKHNKLVNQINGLIIKSLDYNKLPKDIDVITFTSEAILTYASKLEEYERVGKIFIKLLGGNNNG